MSSRYKILEELGSGGSGAVYKAFDTQLDRYVAIKRLLNKEQSEEEDSRADDIKKEAGSLATLQHPNVVSVFDLGSDDEGFFMVMELVDGETLADWISATPMSIGEFSQLATQLLEALVSAHSQNILHRDLKPENIKIRRLPSGKLQVKVLDFGLARLSHSAKKMTEDQNGNIIGSIYYMAPEQFMRQPLDGRTDLYSLGCVLYQALSARRPFEADTVKGVMDAHQQHLVYPLIEVAPTIPEPVCDWVMSLFNVDPDARPASAQQALSGLRGLAMAGWFSQRDSSAVAVAVAVADTGYASPRASSGAVRTVSSSSSQRVPTVSGSRRPPPPEPLIPRRPVKEPEANPEDAAAKKKMWILSGVGVLLIGTAGFFMFRGSGEEEKKPNKALVKSGAVEAMQEPLPGPPERPQGFYQPGMIMHFRAGQKMDAFAIPGDPVPVAKPGDFVMSWHDLISDAGDSALLVYDGKKANCPSLIHEKPDGLRYPLDLLRVQNGEGLIHTLRTDSPDIKSYPLGGGTLAPGQQPGVTVIMVVRPNITTGKETRCIRLRNQDDKAHINVRAYSNDEWKIGMRVGPIIKEGKVTGCNTKLFSVVGFTWDLSTSRLVMAVRNQDGSKGRADTDAPKEAADVLNEIRIADLDNSTPEEKFSGDIAEIMVWPYAMGWEERSGQEFKLVQEYFMKVSTRY